MLRCLCVFLFVVGLPAAEQAMHARSAAAFVDAMGINVVVYDDERHTEVTVPRLAELGIRHLRTGLYTAEHQDYRGNGAVIMARTKALGEAGYRITGVFHCWYDMDQFVAICRELLPEGLHQAEGPNEPWHQHQKFIWRGEGWPQGPRLYMQDMHAALRGDAATAHLPILGFSGTTSAYGSIEQWLDLGNEHIYPDGGRGITQGGALAAKIERCRSTNYPTVPLQFTESGYNAGTGDEPGIRPTSAWMQTRGVPRLFLEGFRHELQRLYLYALNARHDRGFSLLDDEGRPRPAFDALRDLIRLVGGSDQQAIAAGRLEASFDCAVSSVHHLLLQRDDGIFVLIAWNDVDGWDEAASVDIANPDVPARLRFAAAPKRVTLHRPSSDGMRALLDDPAPAAEIDLLVPDHPLVVLIEP